MISYATALTATNTDVLQSTDLQSIPDDGQLDLFIASSGTTSTFTFTGPGNEPVARAITIQQNAQTGHLDLRADVPFSYSVRAGGKYVLNVTRGGAETIMVLAVYRRAEEL